MRTRTDWLTRSPDERADDAWEIAQARREDRSLPYAHCDACGADEGDDLAKSWYSDDLCEDCSNDRGAAYDGPCGACETCPWGPETCPGCPDAPEGGAA